MVLHAEQIRAARSMLGWSQVQLATKAGVAHMTIRRLEAGFGIVRGTVDSLYRVQSALEDAGVLFLSPDAEGGIGVRMRAIKRV
jgi:transcriptional regulator with XRE-family HTH domain